MTEYVVTATTERTSIAQDLASIAFAVGKVRLRIAYEDSDRMAAVHKCATLDEFAAWLEDEAEERR